MPEPVLRAGLAAVEAARHGRFESYRRAVGQLPGSMVGPEVTAVLDRGYRGATSLAVAAHATEVARLAAADGRAEQVGYGLAVLPLASDLEFGFGYFIDASDCLPFGQGKYLSPCWALAPGAKLLSYAEAGAEPALKLVSAAGADLSALVRAGCGVVISAGTCDGYDDNNSWTVGNLSATIFMDTPTVPVRLAEALVHESAHNILFDLVRSEGLRFDEQRTWYSPWKKSQRPPYSYAHSLFAFGTLLGFWHAVRQVVPNGDEGAYVAQRIAYHSARFAQISADVREFVTQYPASLSRECIAEAVAHAG